MASTIHSEPHDAIEHAQAIADEHEGQSFTVFFSRPSNLFAVLPTHDAERIAAKADENMVLVADVTSETITYHERF